MFGCRVEVEGTTKRVEKDIYRNQNEQWPVW